MPVVRHWPVVGDQRCEEARDGPHPGMGTESGAAREGFLEDTERDRGPWVLLGRPP